MVTVYDQIYRNHRILIKSDWDGQTNYRLMVTDLHKKVLSSGICENLQEAIAQAVSSVDLKLLEEAYDEVYNQNSIDDVSVSQCETKIEPIDLEKGDFSVTLVSRYSGQTVADMVVSLSRDKMYIDYSGSFLSNKIADEMDNYETQRNIRWDIQDFLERRAYGEEE